MAIDGSVTNQRSALWRWIRWPTAALGGMAVWTVLSVVAAFIHPPIIFNTFYSLTSWSTAGAALTGAAMAAYAFCRYRLVRRVSVVSLPVTLVIVYWQAIITALAYAGIFLGMAWCLCRHGGDALNEIYSTESQSGLFAEGDGYRNGWDGWGWYKGGWKID